MFQWRPIYVPKNVNEGVAHVLIAVLMVFYKSENIINLLFIILIKSIIKKIRTAIWSNIQILQSFEIKKKVLKVGNFEHG